MAVCCCSLAGTAACQHCASNPFATDVWANKTVTVDHVEAKPFGNGLDVCPVCGKPSTIGKPMTNYNRIISKTPEELAEWIDTVFAECEWCRPEKIDDDCERDCKLCILDWLKQETSE